MRKRWILTAIVLIVVGITGLSFNKFDLGDDTINVEKQWSFDAQSINNLTIKGASNDLDVTFVTSDSNTGSISIEGNTNQETIDNINGTSITGDQFLLDLKEELKFQFFSFNFNFKSTKLHITITLPHDDVIDTVDIGTYSGNLSATNVLAEQATVTTMSGNLNVSTVVAQQATLKTMSGNLIASIVEAQQATLKTTSGNLTVADIQAEESSLESMSGNLKADNITSNLQASSQSGNIKIDQLSGQVNAESSSGNVTVIQSTVSIATVKSSSGNVTFTPAAGFGGFYELRSNSGNINAPDSIGTSTEIIKINTMSGNIKVK